MQSVSEWAALNFGNCELGDKRRTRRLVRLAEQVASHPAASLPDQTEHWKDLKAAYRLFDGEEVTFQAIARSHWELTRQAARGRCLVIGDTTELDFGRLRKIARIGETGNGSGQGFLLHNALLVQAQTAAIVGVAGQAIYYRRKNRTSHRRQNAAQRLARERESQVWNQVIDDIGPPAAGVEYVHVFDRGADSFEVYCHLLQSRSGWVIRAAKLNRYVLAGPQQRRMTLQNYLRQLKPLGRYTLQLRARPGQPARQALLEVRVGRVHIPRPRHVSSEIRRLKQQPIAMNVVEVVEIDPPGGATPIHWILFTSLPVGSFEEAWLVIEYYELRWLDRGISQGPEDRLPHGVATASDSGPLGSLCRFDERGGAAPLATQIAGPRRSRNPRAARRAARLAADAQARPSPPEPRPRSHGGTVLSPSGHARRFPRPDRRR